MRRFPVGVSVVTVDREGERLGSQSPRSSRSRSSRRSSGSRSASRRRLHELLRTPGGSALSLLGAEPGGARAAFRRAGCRRSSHWHGVEIGRTTRGAAARRRARLARVRARRRARRRRPHVLHRLESSRSSAARRPSALMYVRRRVPHRCDRGGRLRHGRRARSSPRRSGTRCARSSSRERGGALAREAQRAT